MGNGMNSKDIKIHTISKLNEQCLIVGTNQPHAVVLSMHDFEVVTILKNIGIAQAYINYSAYA